MYNQESATTSEFERNPDFKDLTLYTSTLYGEDAVSQVRQSLGLQMLGRCNELGIAIVVSDGGSNQGFLDDVKSYPGVTLLHDPLGATMGEARRLALGKALEEDDDPDHIFMYLDAEKVNLVDADSLTKLMQPIRSGQSDIVVPRRIDKSSYPRQQAWIEDRANHRATQLMRGNNPATPNTSSETDLDLWFGPKMFNSTGARYFLNYKSNLDKWDVIIAPVLDAYREGLRVTEVPIDFTYPTTQTEFETDSRDIKRKRAIQYGSILVAMGDQFWQSHELVGGLIRKTEPN